MRNNNGYGLIEVLVSISIFAFTISNSINFVANTFVQVRQIKQLHLVINKVWELNEQLYMLATNAQEEKAQLINSWALGLRLQAPDYFVEIAKNFSIATVQSRTQNQQFVIKINI